MPKNTFEEFSRREEMMIREELEIRNTISMEHEQDWDHTTPQLLSSADDDDYDHSRVRKESEERDTRQIDTLLLESNASEFQATCVTQVILFKYFFSASHFSPLRHFLVVLFTVISTTSPVPVIRYYTSLSLPPPATLL